MSANQTSLVVGSPTAVRLTATNTGDDGGGDEITCVKVQVPSGFAIASAAIVSVHGQTSGPAFQSWQVIWPGGTTVSFKDMSDDYPLVGSTPPLDKAVFRITGTASGSGSMTWTANAADKSGPSDDTNCGAGDDFPTMTLTFTLTGASDTDADSDTNADSDPHTDSGTDAQAHAQANANTGRHTEAGRDASADTDADPGTGRDAYTFPRR